MTYTVTSDVPVPDLDVLSRTDDGLPSIVFQGAIDKDDFESQESPVAIEVRELEDAERFLELPAELNTRIGALAVENTRGLETDFEKGLALEAFFRTPGHFVYSTAIVPGHGASVLSDWLLDPTSENYRIGYCEQFSTSMAVMARTLGIPSRVVLGFTPGTLLEDGRVVVRDRNSHAWVELWMPSQGWVRFDPTPRGDGVNPATLADLPFDVADYLDVPDAVAPQLDLDSQGSALFRDDEFDIPERIIAAAGGSDTATGPRLPGWLTPIGLAIVGLFGLVPAIKWARRRQRMRRLEAGDIGAAWIEIVDRLTDLGDGPAISTTPLEFARRTDPVMRPLAEVYGASVYGTGGDDGSGQPEAKGRCGQHRDQEAEVFAEEDVAPRNRLGGENLQVLPVGQEAENAEQKGEERQQKPAEIDQAGGGAHEVLKAGVSGGDHPEVRDRQAEGCEECGK